MSEQGGPERRRALRHRVGKPYAKKAKPAPAPKQSSFSSLLSIFTAPFKRAVAITDADSDGSQDDTDSASDTEPESSNEVDRQLWPATEDSGTERADASSSTLPGSSMIPRKAEAATGLYPQLSTFQTSKSADNQQRPRWLSPQGAPSTSGSSRALATTQTAARTERSDRLTLRSLTPAPANPFARPQAANNPTTPVRPSVSLPSAAPQTAEEHSPYKEIVDFLQTKKDDKLNQMEIIGLTQSLRKNATKPAQEVIDYLEAASNVPSAALLGTFKQSAPVAASPNKPLLFPPPPSLTSTPVTSSPSRGRRRRNLYTGVGQSPRAGTISTRSPQPSASRLRLQQPFPISEELTLTSNKKRLVGDSAIPMASGASSPVASTSSKETTSSVPFPLDSPAKPQRAPPPSHAGPLSRPTMNGGKGLPFGAPAHPPVTRPEAPRHPSPLRKSNIDLSVSSGGSDADDSFEETRRAPRKSDPSQRSQTSASILDIIMDEANPLPPVKPRVAAELKNPFDEMHPAPPRVSTPVRRVSTRLSRPWTNSPSPAASPAPPKRGIESDNILDQIDSTAPKQSPSKKSRSSELDDLPGVVNPFAAGLGSASNTSSGPGQRMKSPPTTVFRSGGTTSTLPTKSAFGAPSFGSSTKIPLGAPKPSKLPVPEVKVSSAPIVNNMVSVEPVTMPVLSHTTKAKTTAAPANPPAEPKPEIVVLDDSDEEQNEPKIVLSISSKRQKPANDDIIVEEIEDEDDEMGDDHHGVDESMRSESPSPNAKHHAQQATYVEEVEDHASRGAPARSSSRFGGTLSIPNGLHTSFKTASPVVPSPLRQVSIPPEEDELSSTEDETEAKLVSASGTTQVTSSNGFGKIPGPVFSQPVTSEPISPKTRALQLPLQALTSYEIVARDQLAAMKQSSHPSIDSHRRARESVKSLPISKLPHFDMTAPVPSSTPPSGPPSSTGPSPPISATSSRSFDWSAAGMKPPSATSGVSASGEWTCTECFLKNPTSADKCTVCEAPRPPPASNAPTPKAAEKPLVPASLPAAASSGFNWAAAGLKPPPANNSNEWTCPVCSIKNGISAAKCIACEEPRPGGSAKVSATSTPAVSPPPSSSSGGGFNWAAAGLKPPVTSNSNEWTCSVCSLKSPASATKCVACETPRPGASAKASVTSTPAASPPPSSASSGSFNWAAAGMKAPDAGTWTCPDCTTPNKPSATKCAACEAPRP